MNFGHPNLLWLLLILPAALVVFFWWALRERQRLMTQFIQARLLPGLISGVSIARQKLRFIFLIAAVALAIVTIARPQWGHTWEESRQKGLDIVVAIDTSKSMLAEDIAPNRLTRAKLAALDLMKLAKSDRLGVVAFAGGAFLQCPLTIDDNAFQQSLDTLDVNTIPQGGTAMGEAIRTALSAFKEGDNYKVLVLFSDGEDNDEGAVEAAEEAAKEGMRIFTIGIGTADGEILRMRDPKGRTDYIRDEEGNVVKSRLNEGLLQRVASATEGGFYLPLRGAKTIDTLYERGLSPLPKSEGDGKPVQRMIERYHWPLAAAIVLLLLEMLLPERKRVKESKSQTAKANLPATAAAVIAMLVGLPVVAGASPATALKDYKAGRYDKAFEEYQRSLAKKQDDPRLHFNAGAAAFRDGRFDEAVKHFNQALPAQDLKLQEQAYYNLGNTLFRTGESIGEPKKMQESWEDALKQYENALRLNTNNADAKFNHDLVKMRLEELKQQQKQQQQDKQQNKDQNQDKNQENQKDKDKQKDQQQQDKDKQEQQKDDKGGQQDKQQQQAKDDQQKKDGQKSQNPGEKKEQEKKQDQQQAKGDKSGEKSEQDQNAEPQRVAAGAMTPKEAQQLMDAQKGEERALQFVPPPDPKRGGEKLKDW